jgi:hypothetical protein
MLVAFAVAVVLHNGQRRWYLPSALQTGDVVRCVVGTRHIDARVTSGGSDLTWATGGLKLQIDRRANGAVMVECGQTKPVFPPKITMPYVIGPNGLALIRGANTLSRLERIYGMPTSTNTRRCLAMWSSIGLVVHLRLPACETLVAATVSGRRWSSLNGVHIGDSVAEMIWLTQTKSNPVGGRIYVIGKGAQYRSQLIAVIGSKGTVGRFVATLARPPR